MKTYKERIKEASEALKNAEYILIGAGAGFSDAAGLKFSGKRFTDRFQDFIEKYDMEDLYSSSFYPFENMEEKWAYWARHISLNRFETPETELYKKLFNLVNNKKYFVLTTNVEHQFWKAGFPDEKIFATQGDYGYIQCAKGCHAKLYDNEELVAEMIKKTKDCKIPSELVPKCPVCGGEMDVNVRKDQYFIQDEAWDKACENYSSFLKEIRNKQVVFMELGVGFNTPTIIRYPFEQMTYVNPNGILIRLNRDYAPGAVENKNKTIPFEEDMREVIDNL
jgi:NAD-dependent protein deacetylases, SIR2 family